MNHKLEVDSVWLEFGYKRILSDVYLKCETGSVVGILGRNGQGKSCLMNVIYGTFQSAGRSVRIDDITVYKRPKDLLYLPQFHFIPSYLTIDRIFSDFGLSFEDFVQCFEGFKARGRSKFKHLSGGEQRLLEVYIIIKSNAKFVMLDEPFSHISPIQIDKIKEIINEERQRKGFLITDHMVHHVTDMCDKLYLLSNGKTHFVKSDDDLVRLGYLRNI